MSADRSAVHAMPIAGSDEATARSLGAYIQYGREVRRAETLENFGFVIVNELRRVIEYRQAVFWTRVGRRGVRLRAVSGVPGVDADAPFAVWYTNTLRALAAPASGARRHEIAGVSATDLPKGLQSGWSEFVGGTMVWCPFRDHQKRLIGGLCLVRSGTGEWTDHDKAVLEGVSELVGHAYIAMTSRESFRIPRARKWLPLIIFAAMVVASLLIPVRQSVLAPAQVVPTDPWLVTAPLSGVIADVMVRPGEAVSRGTVLFTYEDTELRNAVIIAQRALDVAGAEYQQAEQGALANPGARDRLAMLRANIALRRAELDHARERALRTTVLSETTGIAVFEDRTALLGRPINVGEQVMRIADPMRTELEIALPAADAITLEAGTPLDFYTNVSPLEPLAGTVYRASFQAQPTQDGVVAYSLRAHFTGDNVLQRIGYKGTAKLYGDRVSVFFFLFRRPLAWLRRWTGL